MTYADWYLAFLITIFITFCVVLLETWAEEISDMITYIALAISPKLFNLIVITLFAFACVGAILYINR